jgi:HK97 gp10 family phage protein
MADSLKVQVEGVDELARQLRRVGVSTQQALCVAVLAGAEVIRAAANPLAPEPVIDTEVEESTKERAVAAVGPPKDRWFYQFFETGAQSHDITGSPLVFEGDEGLVITGRVRHPGMVARPFLRPAFDSRKRAAQDKVGDELRRAIEGVGR